MLTINRQTAVLFDLDDTLYCEHDYVRSGFRAAAQYLHQRCPDLKPDACYLVLVQIWETEGRGKIFDRVIETFGLSIEPLELVTVYRGHRPELRLYDDADRLIRLLEDKQIPRGIITDGFHRVQRAKIDALGLADRFPWIMVTDEWGTDHWKPSPFPYRKAMEFFAGQADCFVYIGDNPHKDFVTAKQLGFFTVRIIREVGDHMRTRLAPPYEADMTIHSLDELGPLVES